MASDWSALAPLIGSSAQASRGSVANPRLPAMNLADATLIVLHEAAAYPELASLSQHAYDELAAGNEVPYTVLSDIIGKASEKGLLRAMHRQYSATAYDAILMPILTEVDRQKPVPPRRKAASEDSFDPLTAPLDQLRRRR
jgi:hypothetical protein